MDTTRWVIVGSKEKAHIYKRNKMATELELVETLNCPDARLHEQDLARDKPGQSFESSGPGQHAMDPVTTEAEKLRTDFAGEVAAHIEKARKANLFEHLDLIASPEFLGALRDKLSSQTHQLIEREVSKNVVDADPESLRKYLVDA